MKWPWSGPGAPPARPAVEPAQVARSLASIIGGLSKNIQPEEVTEQTLLFSGGLLDSLAFIELVSRIEGRFDIDLVKVIEVTPQALDRFGDICRVVERALADAP